MFRLGSRAPLIRESYLTPPLPPRTPSRPLEGYLRRGLLGTSLGTAPHQHLFYTLQPRCATSTVAPKLTISLAPFQDKFAKPFLTIAAELWLRGCVEAIDSTFQLVARSVTIRLAEKLAKYIFAHEARRCLGHS